MAQTTPTFTPRPASPDARSRDGSAAALSIRALGKSYGLVDILHSISVEIARGEFLVLVGPSGCGKSTLLNCIAGLEEVTRGTIEIAGRDVTEVPPRDRNIAMVFQSYALYPTMSVADNIGFGMRIRRLPKAEIAARTAGVAKMLQIDHLLDRRPSQLSGGQRQRVAMGRALVREPALFLFDEPLSNLDAKLRVEMRAEIKKLHETTHASIVYVTHDQIEAMTLATKIVVLKGGRVQQIGSPEAIYERPANLFVADFMGAPPMNLVPASLDEAGAALTFRSGQRLPIDAPPPGLAAYRGKPLVAGIRPEHVHLVAPGEGQIEVDAGLVENAGSDAYVSFDLADQSTTARFPGRVRCAMGDRLHLTVDTDRISFFDPATEARID